MNTLILIMWNTESLVIRHQIKCPVHGFIPLTKLATSVVNHPYMQRLRHIKQLGLAYMTFPSANHTRFEHSLGTYYMAGLMVDKVKATGQKFVIPGVCSIPSELTPEIMECVKLAALCHDLGHGPYSHVLDQLFFGSDPHPMADHEVRSISLATEIFSSILPSEYAKFTVSLIHPTDECIKLAESTHSQALYQIVSNYKNGIDVDKFDYLARDTRSVGFGLDFSYQRLLNSLQISETGDITYHRKCDTDVYDLFYSRYLMHKKVYSHRKSKKIEAMVLDLLQMMDPVLGFTSSLNDMSRFTTFTDSTLFEVTRLVGPPEARALLHRIDSCQFYDIVLESRDRTEVEDQVGQWIVAYGSVPFKVVTITCSFAADYSNIRFHNADTECIVSPDLPTITIESYLVICRDPVISAEIKIE